MKLEIEIPEDTTEAKKAELTKLVEDRQANKIFYIYKPAELKNSEELTKIGWANGYSENIIVRSDFTTTPVNGTIKENEDGQNAQIIEELKKYNSPQIVSSKGINGSWMLGTIIEFDHVVPNPQTPLEHGLHIINTIIKNLLIDANKYMANKDLEAQERQLQAQKVAKEQEIESTLLNLISKM